MGVLRVKVAGNWVDVGGSSDPVWVDPLAPSDPNVELWYDTDAESYIPAYVKPWALPWGLLGAAVVTASQAGFDTVQRDIAGMTVTVASAVGRKLKVSFIVHGSCTAQTWTQWFLTDPSNNPIQVVNGYTNASQNSNTFTGFGFLSGAASVTYKLRCVCGAGILNLVASAGAPGMVTIEDVGPV